MTGESTPMVHTDHRTGRLARGGRGLQLHGLLGPTAPDQEDDVLADLVHADEVTDLRDLVTVWPSTASTMSPGFSLPSAGVSFATVVTFAWYGTFAACRAAAMALSCEPVISAVFCCSTSSALWSGG